MKADDTMMVDRLQKEVKRLRGCWWNTQTPRGGNRHRPATGGAGRRSGGSGLEVVSAVCWRRWRRNDRE